MFKSLSLKSKLLLSFAFSSFLLLLVGGLNYKSLEEVVFDYKHVAEINLPNSILLSEMNHQVMVMSQIISVVGMPGVSEAEKKQLISDYQKAQKVFDDITKKYMSVPFQDGEDMIWSRFESSYKEFQDVSAGVLKSFNDSSFDQQKYMNIVFGDLKVATQKVTASYQELTDFHNNKSAAHWVKKADESSSFGTTLSFTLVGVGVILAMGLGWFLSHSLSSTLTNIVNGLSHESSNVAEVAQKISSASNSLSSSSTEQAAALQETVASIEEVSAMVQKNADNSKRSQEKSASCETAVIKGKETVDQMVNAISDISESNDDIVDHIEASNKQLADIVNVINEIATKTTVINDIVFQTKLLSFNASVEAARAGEHGKGFAVVAQEVGNLAEMSGNAAKEITSMLENSIRKVETIVTETKSKVDHLIQNGKIKVEVGKETARRCGQTLDEIVGLVREVNLMVSEISTASQEQSQGVSEINKAMTQMDQVTQMNATSAQDTASAASVLSDEAFSLKTMVEDLSATIHGHGDQSVDHLNHKKPKKMVSEKKGNIISFSEKKVSHSSSERRVETSKKIEEKKTIKPAQATSSKPTMKMASGDLMPSADDPRFEDV